jgi:glycosyltransferase involved in cell wall biosynthesis
MKKILLDCERMKYPHTGLFHFCKQLGDSLLQLDNNRSRFTFYVPPSKKKIFGTDANYLIQSPLHKLNLPPTNEFNLWHATYQATAYYPFERNLKIVLTIHDLNFLYDEEKSERKKARYLARLQKKVDRADHVLAISNFTLNDVFKNLKVPREKISVIYNGCNITEIGALKKPGYVPDVPFLFTIGTIILKKNFHVLPCLLSGNDYQLIISGITQKEDYKKKIIAEAKKWGVENRLVFTGAIDENAKQWYMKNCKAFLFPSISEGFGLPVVEAMHFGKPCILSTHTSLPEIGGTEAYYFENFDPVDMRRTLIESLHHYESHNSAESIIKRSRLFSWKKNAEEHMEVYRRLTSPG